MGLAVPQPLKMKLNTGPHGNEKIWGSSAETILAGKLHASGGTYGARYCA